MLSQVAGEYEEKFEKNNLDLIIKNDVTPVMIQADGRHLWRVFDNLMNNINKYAQPGTRAKYRGQRTWTVYCRKSHEAHEWYFGADCGR